MLLHHLAAAAVRYLSVCSRYLYAFNEFIQAELFKQRGENQ